MNQEYNKKILSVANSAYPDSLVPEDYDKAVEMLRNGPGYPENPGDTLAIFVAIECCEIADGAESLSQAFQWSAGGMRRAAAELSRVAEFLENEEYSLSRLNTEKAEK